MWKAVQRHFLTGLLAVAPLAFTVWILVKGYELIDHFLRPWLQRVPHLTESYPDFVLTFIAFSSFLLLIVLIGLTTRSLVGKAILNLVDRFFVRIPVVKTIFMATKQIATVFLSDKRSAFQKVALFEYPRTGCFSLGFVTHDEPENRLLNLFLPTTPNPTSGYMLLLPRDQVAILSLTVEEGIKLIISGGSVMTREHAEQLQEAAGTLQHLPRESKEHP